MLSVRVFSVFVLFENLDLQGEVQILFEEELLVSHLQAADIFFGEASALEPNDVESAGDTVVAINDHEGWHICDNAGEPSNHGVLPDAAELVNCAEARDDGVVADRDVACESRSVRENRVVPHLAFVGNVRVAEEEIAVSDAGWSLGCRSSVHGDVFAEGIIVADVEMGGRPFLELEVLSPASESSEGKGLAALADSRVALDDDVGMEASIVTEGHVITNNAIGPNLAIGTDLRFGRNESGRMDSHGQ